MKADPSLLEQALAQAAALLGQAAAAVGVNDAPSPLLRRDKAEITSRLALAAPKGGRWGQALATELVAALDLGSTWFDGVRAEKGYINLSLAPCWYEAVLKEIPTLSQPEAFFTPPPAAEGEHPLLRPPPEAAALAAYGGHAPSPLQARENPPYGIWYALRRSVEKGTKAVDDQHPLGVDEREALFLFAQCPYQYRLAAEQGNPHRLYQYLRRVAALFYQYNTAATPQPRLYFCFAQILRHCLAALGIGWEGRELWRNRTCL